MTSHRHITGRQYALLCHLAEAGPKGDRPPESAPPAIVRTCLRRGLIAIVGANHYHITPEGEVERASYAATGKRPRGFGAMPSERVAEIASMGGRAVHASGLAHKFTKGDPVAVAAGKKGSAARAANLARAAKKGDAA